MNAFEFVAAISWPVVAILGILILGPGGYLKSSVGEIANKLLNINSSVKEFKTVTENFSSSQKQFEDSVSKLAQAHEQMTALAASIENIKSSTTDLVISVGKRELESASGQSEPAATNVEDEGLSADEMYAKITERWVSLTSLIRDRIGTENFDGRSVGAAAWKLTDGRRARPIQRHDAELIESLHSQYKRFVRLQSGRQDWLTTDVFASFIRGIEQAEHALGG